MVSNCREPSKIPWKEMGAEYICECTGVFNNTKSSSQHITGGGAKYVIISSPATDDTPTFVYGVNSTSYNGEKIVSNASCTTNCLAPLVHIVNKHFGIEHAMVTTIHAVTSSQNTIDGSVSAKNREKKNAWKIGRCCINNIIPAKTGAAIAINKVISGLDGKISAMAFRVPTPNVSVVDMTCCIKKSTTLDNIMETFSKESYSSISNLNGVVKVSNDYLVSSDLNGDNCSCILDKSASMQLNENFFKLVAWYDNERSYSCRMVDLVSHIAEYEMNNNTFGKKNVKFSV